MKTVGFEVKKKRTAPPKKDAGQKDENKNAQNAGTGDADGKDAGQKDGKSAQNAGTGDADGKDAGQKDEGDDA